MQLESLINQNAKNLTENDWYIWNYIKENRNKTENLSINQLAKHCNVSRTTILRFTKKIGLRGYSEFKVLLKIENTKQQTISNTDGLCNIYQDFIDSLRYKDVNDICGLLHRSKQIYIHSSGQYQYAVSKQLKLMFSSSNRVIHQFGYGLETDIISKMIKPNDCLIMISYSGEAFNTVNLSKKMKLTGVPIISITVDDDNSLAKISDYRLYITKAKFDQVHYVLQAGFFFMVEWLYLKYVTYLNEIGENNGINE